MALNMLKKKKIEEEMKLKLKVGHVSVDGGVHRRICCVPRYMKDYQN